MECYLWKRTPALTPTKWRLRRNHVRPARTWNKVWEILYQLELFTIGGGGGGKEGGGGEGLWGGVHHPSTFISHTRARYLIFPPNFRGWRVYISGESAPQSNTVLGSKCEHSLILSAYTGSFPTDLNSLSPKIHIQILQTDLHTFLFRIVERIWLKIKAFSLS